MDKTRLFHVVSVNATTNFETLVTDVPMTHQQCCKFISLFSIDKRRYMIEIPVTDNTYALNGELHAFTNIIDDLG